MPCRIVCLEPQHKMSDNLIRLSKRISELGIASRREADAWIEKGWVKVNGQIASLGQKVAAGDRIQISSKARQEQNKLVTVLLNKPVGYVSGQAEDGYEPAKVLINERNHWEKDEANTRFSPSQLKHLVPAGRLDIDSVGLLVLTQDGRVAKAIIGETSEIEKEYMKENVPQFEVGDVVKVYVKVVEGNRERLQAFEGTVIARKNGGLRETFIVRRVSFGVGIERSFPIHSPRIEKVEVVRKGRVRRAKLYYLRKLSGKAAKLKEAK